MVFLGIEVNSILLTMSIPGEKMREILDILDVWFDKDSCTVKELLSLAGLLNFAARCVRSGRVYLSRVLNFLRQIPDKGTHKIPRDTLLDIKWWREFFPLFNGVSLMLNNDWSQPDEVLASDSCLTGGGAHINNQFMHFEFPKFVLDKCDHINQLECITLVVAVAKWAGIFCRARIQVYCDNQVTAECINSGFSRDCVMQACLRFLHKVMALESFELKAVYLASEENRIADSLSRYHLHDKYRSTFREFVEGKSMKRTIVYSTDFEFLL